MMHYDSNRDGDFDEWFKKQVDAFEEARINNRNKAVVASVVVMITVMSLLGAAIGYLVLR